MGSRTQQNVPGSLCVLTFLQAAKKDNSLLSRICTAYMTQVYFLGLKYGWQTQQTNGLMSLESIYFTAGFGFRLTCFKGHSISMSLFPPARSATVLQRHHAAANRRRRPYIPERTANRGRNSPATAMILGPENVDFMEFGFWLNQLVFYHLASRQLAIGNAPC